MESKINQIHSRIRMPSAKVSSRALLFMAYFQNFAKEAA